MYKEYRDVTLNGAVEQVAPSRNHVSILGPAQLSIV